MIQFAATIQKFNEKGEKTGWTYVEIPLAFARQLKPGNKKSFRVKGRLDDFAFRQVSLLPMGDGCFIMALNLKMRKKIGKQAGAVVHVCMEADGSEILPPPDLLQCLDDEPGAMEHFGKLSKSNQNYFTNWINSARTETTRINRIAQTINALSKRQNFSQMVRAMKEQRG